MNTVHRFMAIHEAGHAVAHERVFGTIWTSEISIEPLDGTLSRFTHEELVVLMDTPDDEAERLFEKEAICSCAGYAAILAAGYPEEQRSLVASGSSRRPDIGLRSRSRGRLS